jgi:hypothetical protein
VYFKTDGKAYPYFMKGELQSQIPSLRKDFLYFSEYAGKPIEKIFNEDQLKDIQVLHVDETRTSLFRNEGNGNFKIEPFPQAAQLSYVFGTYIGDLNGDRRKDVFMGGNFYGLKPQAGRFDACYGTTLISQTGAFSYISPSKSGLRINGEAREIRPVKKADGGIYIIVAMNNLPLYIFEKAR